MAPTMNLKIRSASGKELIPGGLDISPQATVAELQQAFHEKKRVYYPSRQRFTLPLAPDAKPGPNGKRPRPTVLAASKRLSDYDIKSGDVINFKDLGPQIGYSTVFFWEYFGPLVIFPIFYLFPHVFYPQHAPAPPAGGLAGLLSGAGLASLVAAHQLPQTLATAYWMGHYAKRIAETFLVHSFSHATMPIANLFRNCGYYWGFAAIISYFINHPLYTAPAREELVWAGLALGVICQLANLYCHIILMNLRPAGSTAYVIPRGFLFEFITCANYTTEIVGWLGFNLMSQSLMGYLFMLAGAAQMTAWAQAKHARLRSLFDGKDGREKYPRRWVILPPLI